MRGSATFMCRPEGHCCLVHAVGPVGVVRDPRNLEIPPPSGKAITAEALQVRPWLKPNAVCAADTRRACAQDLINHALGRLSPPPSHVPAALFESCCISRTAPAAMSHNMKARALIRSSATFMCRPKALSMRWGP
jgi:hypothetical protein